MAGNLNKVFLVGNLTRDPELRHTAQGTSVANFSIAVNRSYKGNDGDFKKEVSYFNIVVWGKTGENCSKYLSKGRSVLVEGRLANRSYETQDGQKRTITEIVADNVQFLGGRGDSQDEGGEASGGGDYGSYADGSDDDAVPF
ncbi:MAG: Single-stranded DNA-binding protein [Candidatus Rifleibacterium amylolyticum]|nr:MAG: Single-stranded DNA-binding protein [Candidatus Rifleibacterium amylolyticum]NLF96172.1 single-stranded DNA-binding protein [Candidatus Riflebacteria bacterium]